ncbi:MAG: c-type cytochrome [Myxococcales bacterium]|nr:c-type cytochrome [Myxococcales bacterium]
MQPRWVLGGVALVAACGGPPSPASPSVDTGRALYDRYCALCHGARGVGYSADHATQLKNRTFLATATDELLRVAIERGRPGTPMSAFGKGRGGPLGPAEVDAVIAYVRSLGDGQAIDVHFRQVDGNPDRGLALFRERCAGCHGGRGQGKTAVSLENPTFLATASDGFIRYAIEHGRPGTPMPAFGASLTGQQLDDLTAAIRRWARPVELGGAARAVRPKVGPLVIHPSGPHPKFSRRDDRYVPADQVRDALKAGARMVLLDARPLSDFLEGHIPGAQPAPFHDDLDALAAALPRDGTWIVAYCACPHAASGKVVDALRARGFANTAVLDEGIKVWRERGYPILTGP